jgi:predicted nucleic acid-binding protein
MSKLVIADSSCLIALSKIGQLDILCQLFEHIIIPDAVYYEVVIRCTTIITNHKQSKQDPYAISVYAIAFFLHLTIISSQILQDLK